MGPGSEGGGAPLELTPGGARGRIAGIGPCSSCMGGRAAGGRDGPGIGMFSGCPGTNRTSSTRTTGLYVGGSLHLIRSREKELRHAL